MTKPEGGVPYYCMADSGYYTCLECGLPIHALEFIQGPKARTRGKMARWHYDCDDVYAEKLHQIAAEDARNAPVERFKRNVHGFRR